MSKERLLFVAFVNVPAPSAKESAGQCEDVCDQVAFPISEADECEDKEANNADQNRLAAVLFVINNGCLLCIDGSQGKIFVGFDLQSLIIKLLVLQGNLLHLNLQLLLLNGNLLLLVIKDLIQLRRGQLRDVASVGHLLCSLDKLGVFEFNDESTEAFAANFGGLESNMLNVFCFAAVDHIKVCLRADSLMLLWDVVIVNVSINHCDFPCFLFRSYRKSNSKVLEIQLTAVTHRNTSNALADKAALTNGRDQAHSGAVGAIALAGFSSLKHTQGGHDHPFSRGLFCVRSSVLHMVSRAMGGFGLPVSLSAGLLTRCSARRQGISSSFGEYITLGGHPMAESSIGEIRLQNIIKQLEEELIIERSICRVALRRLAVLSGGSLIPSKASLRRREEIGLRVINGGAA